MPPPPHVRGKMTARPSHRRAEREWSQSWGSPTWTYLTAGATAAERDDPSRRVGTEHHHVAARRRRAQPRASTRIGERPCDGAVTSHSGHHGWLALFSLGEALSRREKGRERIDLGFGQRPVEAGFHPAKRTEDHPMWSNGQSLSGWVYAQAGSGIPSPGPGYDLGAGEPSSGTGARMGQIVGPGPGCGQGAGKHVAREQAVGQQAAFGPNAQ
jgi:hypothetical protein